MAGRRMNWDKARKRETEPAFPGRPRRADRAAVRIIDEADDPVTRRRLTLALGTRGIKCSTYTIRELADLAVRFFGVPDGSVGAVALAVDRMPSKVRGQRFRAATGAERISLAGSEAPPRRLLSEDAKENIAIHAERKAKAADAPTLLRQLMVAVLNAGMGDILTDLPEVVEYFGGHLPTPAEMATAIGVESGEFHRQDGAVIRYSIASAVHGGRRRRPWNPAEVVWESWTPEESVVLDDKVASLEPDEERRRVETLATYDEIVRFIEDVNADDKVNSASSVHSADK